MNRMGKIRKKTTEQQSGNPAFRQLANLLEKAGLGLQTDEKPAAEPVSTPLPEPPSQSMPESDDELFGQAMEGVIRSTWRHEPVPTPQRATIPPAELEPADLRLLQEALEGSSPPPILDHPEYIEGWVGVAGRRFLPNLRNGVYSIQGALDLHGLGKSAARIAVEDFIIRMSCERSCCVKIVHGRGINSPSDKAVLKENLQRWLTTRRMAQHVVAYASAPYADGGVGAVYVLVRKSHGFPFRRANINDQAD